MQIHRQNALVYSNASRIPPRRIVGILSGCGSLLFGCWTCFLDCSDCLDGLHCFGIWFGLLGLSRFDSLDWFSDCLDSLDCSYGSLGLFGLFVLF